MLRDQSRRNFIRTAPLAAAAASPLTDKLLFAAQSIPPTSAVPFQLFTAAKLADDAAKLQAAPGNNNLFQDKSAPLHRRPHHGAPEAAKDFELHEGRDHIVQILDGTTLYEVGGTPQNAHSTKPGEWHAPTSAGSTTYTLNKGDMLVIPRGHAPQTHHRHQRHLPAHLHPRSRKAITSGNWQTGNWPTGS